MFNKIIISLIALAIVFRFIGLDNVPPHLTNDEIGAAYDAYSISKTLRDEHNQFLPITFLSHGIYRSALAVYLTIPGLMILGNSDFSARLPSAILGSFTIILLGMIVFELTKNSRLALLTSAMLAFSPGHFSASRWTMESNYALFFLLLGIYLFFYGLRHKKPIATLVSSMSFALSIYAYYTEWGLTPLIVSALLFLYRKTILKSKIYLIAFILFAVLLTPLGIDFLSHADSSRAATELVNKDIAVTRLIEKNNFNFFQKGQIILKAFFNKYSQYTNTNYIFSNGADLLPVNNPYQVGFFLSPFLVSFILGFFKLKNYFGENRYFILLWLVISPVVPALTLGALSFVRILPLVAPISVISAVGTLYILENIYNKLSLKILAVGLVSISFLYFVVTYFFHFPFERAEGFQYGFKQIALYTKEHYSEYNKFIIDPRFGDKEFYFYGVPHVYIPFYTNMDPRKLQNARKLTQGLSFDKYETRFINWNQEKLQQKHLYIVPYDNNPASDIARTLKKVFEIQLPNHKVEFVFYALPSNNNPLQ